MSSTSSSILVKGPARLAHIAALCSVGKRSVSVLMPLASEVAEEINLARSHTPDDSTLDPEYNYEPSVELVSRLSTPESIFEARDRSRHDSDNDIMTARERIEAAQDLWRYRHPVNLWLAPVSLFAPAARLTA